MANRFFRTPQVISSQGAGRAAQAEEKRNRFFTAQRQAFFNDVSLPDADLRLDPDAPGGIGFFEKLGGAGVNILDILQRGNFAAAGIAEELFVNKAGPLEALGRAGSEIFSGIGNIRGQKDTFVDVLDGIGLIDDTELRDVIGSVDDIPLLGGVAGSFNLRGTVGLALDIALDPLTYLSGGGAALARAPKAFKALARPGAVKTVLQVDDAARAFTKAGTRNIAERNAAEMAGKAGIRDLDKEIAKEVFDEADRLAIDGVQDQLAVSLSAEGIKLGSAARIAGKLVPAVANTEAGAAKAARSLLNTLPKQTASKLRKVLSLEEKAGVSEIGASLAARVRQASRELTIPDLADGNKLLPLVEDLTLRKSTLAVVEQAKHTPGLMRDIAPLRWNIPFTDVGFNIGPAGKTFTSMVVDSGVSKATIRAMNKRLPQGAINAGLATGKAMQPAFELMGRVFNRDWAARKFAGYRMLKQAHIDGVSAAVGKNAKQIQEGPLGEWYTAVWKANKGRKGRKVREATWEKFATAIDTGDMKLLPEGSRAAAVDFVTRTRQAVLSDLKHKLIRPNRVRANYFPHFMDAGHDLVQSLRASRPGVRHGTQATIGRHAEARGFQSVADIRAAERVTGIDAKLDLDPLRALSRRTDNSIEGAMASEFYESVGHGFGRKPVIVSPQAVFELTRQLTPLASKAGMVAERLARNLKLKPSPQVLAKMLDKYGADSVADYLRLRLIEAPPRSPRAATKWMIDNEPFLEALPRISADVMEPLGKDGLPFVTIPVGFRELKHVQVPDGIAKDLERMASSIVHTEDMGVLLRGYDNFQNSVKKHLTAMFPAFHFRNAYSNVAQLFVDIGVGALNPVVHTRAAVLAAITVDDTGRVLTGVSRRFQPADLAKTAWKDPAGNKVSMGQAARELVANDIVKDQKAILEGVGKGIKADLPVEGMTHWQKIRGFWGRAGRATGGFVENEARIVGYMQLRRRGLTPRQATERINQMLFDYQALSLEERTYLKRGIPFYVWTKKNVAQQARAIRNQPGRVVNMTKPFGNEDPDVNPVLAQWQQGQLKIQLDRDGKHVRMLTGIDLPIHNVDRILPIGKLSRGQFSAAFQSVLSQMTPAIKVPFEIGGNVEAFSGRSLDRARSPAIGALLDPEGKSGRVIPQSVRDWLGYTKTRFPNGNISYSFDGNKFHLLFRSWQISRYLSSSDRWFNEATSGNSTFATNMLTLATSLKVTEVNMDEAQLRQFGSRTRRIQDELIKKGLLIRRHDAFQPKSLETGKPRAKFGSKGERIP